MIGGGVVVVDGGVVEWRWVIEYICLPRWFRSKRNTAGCHRLTVALSMYFTFLPLIIDCVIHFGLHKYNIQ